MNNVTHRIKDHKVIPYGGEYTATHPATNITIRARSMRDLYRAMIDHCKANNQPIPLGFEDIVESWFCKNHADSCEEYVQDLPLRPRVLGWQDVLRGTKVMLKHWANGSVLVDDAEANRRASICANCPLNSKIQYGCSGLCGELKDLLVSVTGAKKTAFDGVLQSCSICHCFNAVSVWIDLGLQLDTLTPEMKDAFAKLDWCWKKA